MDRFFIALFLGAIFMNASAQDNGINYDESKVPPYTLPDPLVAQDGSHIVNSRQWLNQQRPVMLKLFAENVYGRMPGKPKNMWFKISSVDSFALGGNAIRKQVTIFFDNDASSSSMDVLIYLPRATTKPVPVF